MSRLLLCLVLLSCAPTLLSAQHSHQQQASTAPPQGEHTESRVPHFRIAILMGHTIIAGNPGIDSRVVPCYGLDVEFWHTHKLGIGLHSDLELDGIYSSNRPPEVEGNVNSVVLSLDALYKVWRELIVQAGPGLEIRSGDKTAIFRAGLEYEIDLGHGWDVCPSAYIDAGFHDHCRTSIAIGMGKRF